MNWFRPAKVEPTGVEVVYKDGTAEPVDLTYKGYKHRSHHWAIIRPEGRHHEQLAGMRVAIWPGNTAIGLRQ